MAQPQERLNRAQKNAKEYMDKHAIEKIISDMLNTLIHSRDEKPLIFMIKYLSGLCPEEDLAESGIKISGHLPKRLPILRYPQFTDSSASLLKKHLTEPLWRDLRGLKTKYDGRVANCIYAGIENPALPVGVYACDDEAYTQFRKLFEPIIKDVHDYDIKSGAIFRHHYDISALEWGKLERAKYCIKFVQVTGSRNLDGYPFVPILDSLSKCEIENKLSKVLVEEIDAKIQINKMTAADKRKFGEEGLLFDRHPAIESIIPNGKWSEGCSIYYNNDLSQVIWINADDHVQYFITHRLKPDLRGACEKLFARLKALEASVPLSQDPNLGYLTCNPSFLGTALRIKVVVQLQKASESQIKFELLRNFCLQQGIEVRHAGPNMYELTMSRTFQLGKTESEMVAGLVNSLAEILRVEETVVLMEEETIKKKMKEETEKVLKDMPIFDEINTSLIRPFISEDVWIRLGRIPSSFGHSLKECVKPGVMNHKIGLIALDADCYHKYEELFMNVIQIYHEDYKPMNFPLIPSDPKEIVEALKKYETIKYVAGGYVMWQGNMKDCSFPGGLSKKLREECVMKLLVALDAFNKQNALALSGIEDSEEVKNTLFYTDLMAEKNKVQEFSVDWPDQRRVLKSPTGKLTLLVNVMNHLAISLGLDIKSLSSDISLFFSAFDSLVAKQPGIWAFSEKLGYYSSIPTEIGNGFNIKIAMKLPSIANLGSYLPLAESKRVILSVVDNVMYFSHKHKFKSIAQCILDVLDVVSTVARLEEERENKAKESLAKKDLPADAKPEEKKHDDNVKPAVPASIPAPVPVPVPAPAQPEPMVIPKEEAKKPEIKKEEDKKPEVKIAMPTFPAEFKGAFKKYLSEGLVKEYELTKAPSGLTFKDIMTTSLANPNDKVGLFAEGVQSFQAFGKLYATVVKGLSQDSLDLMTFNSNLTSPSLNPLELLPVPAPATGTVMEISRNLADTPFPPYMQDKDRISALSRIEAAVKGFEAPFHGQFVPFEAPNIQELLKAGNLSEEIKLATKCKDGVFANWPKHRAAFITDDNSVAIVVNVRDHIKIIVKIVENKAKEAYAKLCAIHNLLGTKVKYAEDPKLGFLSSDLENIISGGFSVEAKMKNDVTVAAKEKVRKSKLVWVIKEQNTIRVKGKARFGATVQETIQAVYQVIKP